MPKAAINHDLEQAAKDGEFRGQVLAKLSSLETAVGNFNSSQTSYEARLRAVETDLKSTVDSVKSISTEFTHQINVNIPKILQDSENTHDRLYKRFEPIEVQLSSWQELAKQRTIAQQDHEDRIRKLEDTKAAKDDLEKACKDIALLKRYTNIGLGVVGTVQFLIGIYISIHFK